MKEKLEVPSWLVKKAKRSITLYHFYKIERSKWGPGLYAFADWVIVVSFQKGLNVRIYDAIKEAKAASEYLQKHRQFPEGYTVQDEYSIKSIKAEKWMSYMGHEFIPTENQSAEELLKANPAIKWHVIDTIFAPFFFNR
jgi:hypothetical protein